MRQISSCGGAPQKLLGGVARTLRVFLFERRQLLLTVA